MAELVMTLGLKQEPGFLYFVREGAVLRTKMARATELRQREEPELVWRGNLSQSPWYLYFVDGSGNISRVRKSFTVLLESAFDGIFCRRSRD